MFSPCMGEYNKTMSTIFHNSWQNGRVRIQLMPSAKSGDNIMLIDSAMIMIKCKGVLKICLFLFLCSMGAGE